MSYYNYRWRFWKRIGLWLGLCALLLACGAAGGFAVGRYVYPNTAEWDLALEDARANAESDYYRGVLSSCIGVGMQMGLPQEAVIATCSAYWKAAYQADWYDELRVDSWQFPPEPAGD